MSDKKSRRGKGEGSVTQLPDGRWRGYITTGYGPKGAIRKYFYGATWKDVRNRVGEATGNQRKGLPIVPERQTVGDFLVDWLETTAKDRLRPTTFVSYKEIVDLHLVPELGRKRLARLSPQDVQGLLAKKAAPKQGKDGKDLPGLSPRRVQFIRAVLRVALNQALRWGMVGRNVATLVDGPRVPRHDIEPVAPEDVPALLKAIQGDRLEGLYSLALASGLRQGELLGVRWQDVDLDKGTLRVVVSLQRIDGVLQLVEPKTDRSRRTLTLPKFAVNALRAHRTRQLEDRLLAGSRWQETGLVFTSTIGTPLSAPKVTVAFQGLLEKAGLPRRRFHDLRHACASLLFAQGVPARMVMETLGHSQIATTMDVYTHIMPAMRDDVAERMDAVFGSG